MAVEAFMMYRSEGGTYHGTAHEAKEANVDKYVGEFVVARVERTVDWQRSDIAQFIKENVEDLHMLTGKCIKELEE